MKAPKQTTKPRNRRIAGEDPLKRQAILDGARHVFIHQGFDAASTDDIARAAGVSKSTLYVYFTNKERLFLALVEAETADYRQRLLDALAGREGMSLEQQLASFGAHLLMGLARKDMWRAKRIILGVTERMADVGQAFFERGPCLTHKRLSAFLAAHADGAGLVIADVSRAAWQFFALLNAETEFQGLYGVHCETISPERAKIQAHEAARLFCKAYKQ